MENNEKELTELKSLYDELWRDAKSMIKDMRKSISIYMYASILTFTVAIITISFAITYTVSLLQGGTSFFNYLGAIGETAASIVIVIFGITLLRWYRRLGKKYSKLIQMEREFED